MAPLGLLAQSESAPEAEPSGDEIIELAEFQVGAFPEDMPVWVADYIDLTFTSPLPAQSPFWLDQAPFAGINLHRRSLDSVDPVIRDMSTERIATLLEGHPLVAASPTRTASPLQAFAAVGGEGSPRLIDFPDASRGRARSGAAISLSLAEWNHPREEQGVKLATTLDVDRAGGTLFGEWMDWDNTRPLSALRVGVSAAYLEDATDGDGRKIPGERETVTVATGLVIEQGNARLKVSAFFAQDEAITNLALPLDTKESPSWAVALQGKLTDDSEESAWLFRLGFSGAEPFLTNADRPGIPMVVSMEGQATVFSGGLGRILEADARTWQFGADFQLQWRDATRFRGPALDRIWPDVTSHGGGFYVTWQSQVSLFQLMAGGRLDLIATEAGDADALALGKSIREQWAAFYHDPDIPVDRTDAVPSFHLSAEFLDPDQIAALPGLQWKAINLGLAYTSRVPGPLERYRAFLNALGGGWELGNPDLDPEHRLEAILALALRFKNKPERYGLSLTVSAAYVYGHISRQVIGVTTPPPPPPPGQTVYGYINRDVITWSARLQADVLLTDSLTLLASGHYTHAQFASNGIHLAEIAPAEGHLSLRWQSQATPNRAPHLETAFLRGRFVSGKSNPAPATVPTYSRSGAFALLDASTSWRLGQWEVTFELRNVFDTMYSEYLSLAVGPNVPLGSGLTTGERIPGRGRHLLISAHWRF